MTNRFDNARDEMLSKLKDIVAENHPGEDHPQDTVEEVASDA